MRAFTKKLKLAQQAFAHGYKTGCYHKSIPADPVDGYLQDSFAEVERRVKKHGHRGHSSKFPK